MNGPYSLYNAATGQLTGQTFGCNVSDPQVAAAFASANTPTGFAMYEGVVSDINAQRIDLTTLALVARGACPVSAAVAARVVTLSGVPSGAAYLVSGDATASGTTDASGTLALTFGAAGTYLVAVACFPLLDYLGSFTLS